MSQWSIQSDFILRHLVLTGEEVDLVLVTTPSTISCLLPRTREEKEREKMYFALYLRSLDGKGKNILALNMVGK